MKKILHIVASPRGENSRTLKIAKALLDRLGELIPGAEIDELNVFEENLPEMNITRVSGKYQLMSGQPLGGEAERSWQKIVESIQRFMSADIIVVSTPMWNFSIPYRLKHYLDIILQPGYTFSYGANGPEGMAVGKKVFVVSTHGGDYSEAGPASSYNQLKPYLQQIFAFIGVTDQTFISAQPMDAGGADLRERMIAEAVGRAQKISL